MYIKCMPAFSARDRHLVASAAGLGYANPFLPERIAFEKALLGREFQPAGPVWSVSVTNPHVTPANVTAIYRKLNGRIDTLRETLASATNIHPEELAIYEESVHYLLYQRYYSDFESSRGKVPFYRDFLADWNRLL